MPKFKRNEFSLTDEVDKLKKFLSLPITNAVFDERYEYGKLYLDENMDLITMHAKLYVNDDIIGTVPYISTERGFGYLSEKHLEFDWGKIYAQYQDVIFDKMVRREPLAATAELAIAEIKRFGSLPLYVKDKDGVTINIAVCDYRDNEWIVALVGLNPVIKVKTITVRLTPPPFSKNG